MQEVLYNSFMNLSSLPITYQKVIPEEYIDIMGHVNVMYYTHLFDTATYALFDLFGFSESYLHETNNGSFAVENHTRYLAEVRVGQAITIHSRLLGFGQSSVHFMNFMQRDHDGALAATSEFVGLHVDMQSRRTAHFPPEIVDKIKVMLENHSQLDWDAPVCGVMAAR